MSNSLMHKDVKASREHIRGHIKDACIKILRMMKIKIYLRRYSNP